MYTIKEKLNGYLLKIDDKAFKFYEDSSAFKLFKKLGLLDNVKLSEKDYEILNDLLNVYTAPASWDFFNLFLSRYWKADSFEELEKILWEIKVVGELKCTH